MKAIITISGGIDSATCAAIATQQGFDELYFLTVNYGQKNFAQEEKNTKFFAKYYNAKQHKIVDMKWLGELGVSGTTDRNVQFDGVDKNIMYVPFRNTVILSAALAWAELVPGVEKIFMGSEAGPWTCPDNSPQYFEAMNNLIKCAMKNNNQVVIEAPLNYMDKAQIILKAIELKVPLEHTWTCVSSAEKQCGVCPPCQNRIETFAQLGIEDPAVKKEDV